MPAQAKAWFVDEYCDAVRFTTARQGIWAGQDKRRSFPTELEAWEYVYQRALDGVHKAEGEMARARGRVIKVTRKLSALREKGA